MLNKSVIGWLHVLFASLSIVVFVAVPSVAAQTDGTVGVQENYATLVIRVTDQGNAVIVKAQVAVRPEVKGLAADAETGVDGLVLVQLPPGDYTIDATEPSYMPGYRRVHLEANKLERISIALAFHPYGEIVHICSGDCPPIMATTIWTPTEVLGPTVDVKDVNPVPRPSPVSLQIKVTDESGHAVPYAQVDLLGEACYGSSDYCGVHTTDADGVLKLNVRPSPHYALHVTRPFFLRWRLEQVGFEESTRFQVVLTRLDIATIAAAPIDVGMELPSARIDPPAGELKNHGAQ